MQDPPRERARCYGEELDPRDGDESGGPRRDHEVRRHVDARTRRQRTREERRHAAEGRTDPHMVDRGVMHENTAHHQFRTHRCRRRRGVANHGPAGGETKDHIHRAWFRELHPVQEDAAGDEGDRNEVRRNGKGRILRCVDAGAQAVREAVRRSAHPDTGLP